MLEDILLNLSSSCNTILESTEKQSSYILTQMEYVFFSCLGHISGRHETHRTLTACPLYHNMSAEECKVSIRTGSKRKRRMCASVTSNGCGSVY